MTRPMHSFQGQSLPTLTRRQLLQRCGMGFGLLGLGGMAPADGIGQQPDRNPLASRVPPLPAKAKRVIHIFLNGGPSHVDTFDPKPSLTANAGKMAPEGNLKTERPTGVLMASPFKFQPYGESGIEVSELFAKTAQYVDQMAVIRSMHADVPNHEPSLLLMNCGDGRLVRPSFGSWITYGLGSDNENLPAFMALCPGGYPIMQTDNWRSAFLPGSFQATYVDPTHDRIDRLIENTINKQLDPQSQRSQLDLLQELNAEHLRDRGGEDPRLESQILAHELAFRMQGEAAEAFDVRNESQATLDRYGPGVQARQLLIARRLIERGVRVVQVWAGAGQPWDHHDDLEAGHRRLASECDQPIAALLGDLIDRGLLEETLVVWGGEFGRTPAVEMPKEGSNQGKMNGRDHNHHGFTMWLAGGGVRGGQAYGATDELGFAAVENRVHVHDLHATLLRLLGFDHKQLTYRYAGRDFRLTDVHGRIIEDLIA
jgi:hypothetical protein